MFWPSLPPLPRPPPLPLFPLLFLLHSIGPVLSIPSILASSNAAAQNSAQKSPSSPPAVPGQIFAGDQLPSELRHVPIVQPVQGGGGTSEPGHRTFVSSFSGYSFDYRPPPSAKDAAAQNRPASPNLYDGLAGTQVDHSSVPPPSLPPSSSPPPPGSDAFVLRPRPVEQFLLPPIHPPQRQTQNMAEIAKFLPPPDSQKPKLTGWVIGVHAPPPPSQWQTAPPFPGGAAIVNPAAYYMEGANLNRIRAPRCSLIGCKGPVPNDFDFRLEQQEMMDSGGGGDGMEMMADRACHRMVVPLNGQCMQGRGYPIVMVCTVCCECSAEVAEEMGKSRGWAQGFGGVGGAGGGVKQH